MVPDPVYFLVIPAFLFSIVAHEWAHGWVAERLGDPTPRIRGRRTLNPLPHLHPVGSVIVPVLLLIAGAPFLVGWGRPMPVDRARLRRPHDDVVRVALAGPLVNLLLAVAFAVLVRLMSVGGAGPFVEIVRQAAVMAVVWNCAMVLFHLIPLPPLDGAWILMRFIRLRHVIALHAFRWVGFGLLALLMTSAFVVQTFVVTPVRAFAGLCLAIVGAPPEGLPL